jgi:hypothetical protein
MVRLVLLVLFLACGAASAEDAHRCSAAASKQALQLLRFHAGNDDRIEIDRSVKVMAPIRNPANKRQALDVLEVWGYIYKAQYRMHFIYAQLPGECVLVGQEVLEYATL